MKTMLKRTAWLAAIACTFGIGWICGFAAHDFEQWTILPAKHWTPEWVTAIGQWAGVAGGLGAVVFAAAAWTASSGMLKLEYERDRSIENRELRNLVAWNIGPTGSSGTARTGDREYAWIMYKVEVKNEGRSPVYDLRVGLARQGVLPAEDTPDVQQVDLLLPQESKMLELSWEGKPPLLGDSDQTVSPWVSFTDVDERRWTHHRGRLTEGEGLPVARD
ncbi:hypothetical protein GL325_14945 [Aeromicrobium sp. 636]|uniref:Uncharacterized protein n=1 Tax=Aeromicrobium senzhongii TaxID=2663859 RepID=A0A8I0EWM9_9ACTN|nr:MULTISPECIES: hypothetical protein [Aeromicrobium]MBC9227624.1 hypothetical protein [Aeromicrobium senzhongii]MCQ3999721.1 hypothetical protein [Aeromicrobium sp. 636]